MRASLDRSPQTRPTSVPHPTHERIGERVAVGVEHVPVNVSENAAEPCPITVCTALAMRRHVVYHDDPQVLELCLHPCDRLHWLRRVPTRSSVGITLDIVGAAQGPFLIEWRCPPLVEPPKTGRTRERFATLPFPVP
jgi:hypothetical protein